LPVSYTWVRTYENAGLHWPMENMDEIKSPKHWLSPNHDIILYSDREQNTNMTWNFVVSIAVAAQQPSPQNQCVTLGNNYFSACQTDL